MPGQDVGGVRAAQDDELGGERPEALDLLHRLHGLLGVDRAKRRGVQDAVQGGVGDGVQVLRLASGQVEVEGPQHLRGGEGAPVAVPGDEVLAKPGCLHDADALGQHRPGGGFVERVEPAGPQAGQPGLGVGDDRVAAGDVRPAAAVGVQGQEPARLRGGRLEVAVPTMAARARPPNWVDAPAFRLAG